MKRTFLLTILAFASLTLALAAGPADGKYFRFTNQRDNSGKKNLVMYEDWVSGQVRCTATSSNSDYTQLWKLVQKGQTYTLMNAYTGNYIQNQGSMSSTFLTGEAEQAFYIKANGSFYNVSTSSSGGNGLHCDASNNVVLWWDAAADGNKWTLSEVSVSEEAVALNIAAYQQFKDSRNAAQQVVNDVKSHASAYNTTLRQFFVDDACTQLTPAAAVLTDDELRAAMSTLPAAVADMAVKIKNASWGHREEEFRIRSYKAYSEPDYWADKLMTKMWCRINNPTGISVTPTDVVFVFVDDDVPAGATLWMETIHGTDVSGTQYPLHKGINALRADGEVMLFLQYVAATTVDGSKLITDYPPIRVHVEGGRVDGFFEKGVHTDADWVDISQSLSQSKAIQIKGDHILMNLDRSYVTASNCCPGTITDAIGWWDNMISWQRALLGCDNVVPSRCNNLACAISLDGGYQSATNYRTQYAANYIHNLLPYESMMSNADNCWGPGHENGHTHQHAIQMIGTAESSNNLFSNLTLNKLGKYQSRGDANKRIFDDYAAGTPWTARSIDITHRMYWQLYLYFHEAGIDPTFYPRLFQAMRDKPLAARAQNKHSVSGSEDVLRFARNVCDVAQLDLSEFFQFWGFCTPTSHLHVDDYGDYDITNTQKEIDEFLAYARQYPKGPDIEFIEDRVKAVPRTDGGSGNKLQNGVTGASAGAVGHYTDFMDAGVKAEGYLYSVKGSTITLSSGKGAVGFKVYDKLSGQLLYGSNLLTFTLPASAEGHALRIVACQADGTDVPVLSTAEGGTEAQQLAALKASLTAAKAVLDMGDAEGYHVGWYINTFLASLQQLYAEASAASAASDQSVHTYGQWSVLLSDAVAAVQAMAEARIPVHAENYYSLSLVGFPKYTVNYLASGLKGSMTSPDGTPSKQWQLVPAGEPDTWYIYSPSEGFYVSNCTSGARVKAARTDVAGAVSFVLEESGAGKFTLRVAGEQSLYLGYNSSKELVGQTTSSSLWALTVVVDNYTPQLTTLAERQLMLAEGILSETVATRQPLTLLPGVTPHDGIDLPSLLQRLATAADAVHEAIASSPALLDYCLTELSAAIAAADGAYDVAATLPQVSAEATRAMCYLVKDVRFGGWCTVENQRGRLKTTDDPDLTDPRYVFFLLPGEAEGTVRVINLATGIGVGLDGNYLCSTDKRQPADFTISRSDDTFSLLLQSADLFWMASSTHSVQARAAGTGWKFIPLGERDVTAITPIHADDPVWGTGQGDASNAPLYDLQGRPAGEPHASGLYILRGHKVIVR